MADRFDIFVSHNSRDKPLIDPIVQRLYDEFDIRCWLDKWDLYASAEWEPAIRQALESCNACAVVLGASGWGPHHLDEARLALDRRDREAGFRIFPVLLPGANSSDMAIVGDLFERVHRVDFSNGVDDEEAFQRLLAAIRGEAPGPPLMTVFAVNRAARQWQQSGLSERESVLYRGGELRRAQSIAAVHAEMLSDTAVRFLTASAESEQRNFQKERTRTRAVIGGLVTGLILVTMTAIFAYHQRNVAQSRAFAARAEIALATDPDMSVRLATAAFETYRTDEAEMILRRSMIESRVRAVMRGHMGAVNAFSLSPDGKRVVTAGADGTARLWETSTGRNLFVLRKHTQAVNSATFSHDGKLILTASSDGTVCVWNSMTGDNIAQIQVDKLDGGLRLAYGADAALFDPDDKYVLVLVYSTLRMFEWATGRQVTEMRGHGIDKIAFNPDGRWALSSGQDGTARVWDTHSGQQLLALRGGAELSSSAFSCDGKLIVTAGSYGGVHIWDTATGRSMAELKTDAGWTALDAQFSPDGKKLVTAGTDGIARVWDPDTGEDLLVLRGHRSSVLSAQFSADGRFIVTSSSDGTAKVWEANSGAMVADLRGHTDSLVGATFNPDGSLVITASGDGTVRVWDTLAYEKPLVLRGHTDRLAKAAFSPDGRQVVTASWDTTARLWETDTGKLLHVLTGHTDRLLDVNFSHDGKWVATASKDGSAKIWDTTTGKQVTDLQGHTAPVTSIVFSPDDKRVVTSSEDKTARIWRISDGGTVATLRGHTWIINEASFDSTGERVITAGDDRAGRVWQASTGRLLFTLPSDLRVEIAEFSPDGRYILTCFTRDGPTIWDGRAGKRLHVLKGTGTELTRPHFSPDGKYVLGTYRNGLAQIWDTATGVIVTTLHDPSITAAAFSHDTRFIVTADEKGNTRVWSLTTGENLLTYFGLPAYADSVAFSSDAEHILNATIEPNAVTIYGSSPFMAAGKLIELASRRTRAGPDPEKTL